MPFNFRKKNARTDGKYIWTNHAKDKMRHYRLTESRITRIIRHPTRTEESVLEGAIAAMQPAGGKQYSEIWVMYVIESEKSNMKKEKLADEEMPEKFRQILSPQQGRIKIITAWRYPGKSPARDPIPEDILSEIRNLI